MNQKTTIIIVHVILFIQVVSEKLNGRWINVSQITLRTREKRIFVTTEQQENLHVDVKAFVRKTHTVICH